MDTQSHERIQTACLCILAPIAVGGAMYLLRAVLVPLVLTVLLTCCVPPAIDVQVKRLRIPRMLAVVTSIGLGLLVLFPLGLLVGVALALIGVDFALMFGMLAFLLNFIPSVGSVIATLLPWPVVLLRPEVSVVAKAMAFAAPGVIRFTLANVLQPGIMGRSLGLHPIAILLSLMFFGTLWGVVGMILATSITSALKILLERFEYARPLAALLEGRSDGRGS